MTDTAHYHASCCVDIDLKAEGSFSEEPPVAKTFLCPVCGAEVEARLINEFEAARYASLDEDCINCGEGIVFLPDRLAWFHIEPDRDIAEPDYGIQECEHVMQKLLGTPNDIPAYAGLVAEPSQTHVTLDLKTGEERKVAEQAEKAKRKKKKQAVSKTAQSLSQVIQGFGKSVTP